MRVRSAPRRSSQKLCLPRKQKVTFVLGSMACSSDLLDCSICLQLLEEPVTTVCGHSFCRGCIETFWKLKVGSCPQCRRTFSSRPVLHKNIVLVGLVDDYKRGSAATDEDDVPCDICKGRKKKADMYCLVCLASYCQTHLQPHLDAAPLKKHSLVQASTKVTENICRRHDRRLEMFCCTDQQLLCPLCVLTHNAHDVVEIKEEMAAKQRLIRIKRQETENRVKESVGEMMELKKAADSIRDAAWEACDDFEQQCAEHIRWYPQYLYRKCMEMRETVGQLEKAGLDWTWSRRGQLERDVNRLKGVQHKLSQLSQTDDPIQFFQGFQALTDLPTFKGSEERPDSLEEFVSACKKKLKNTCTREKDLLFHQRDQKELKIPRKQHQDVSRKGICASSKYADLELDLNTAPVCLSISKRKTSVFWGQSNQVGSDHPDRFTYFYQVLCQRGLRESSYWEVMWDGGVVEVAVSYIGIQRKGSGSQCCFGHNNLSWKLTCSPSGCTFWHDKLHRGGIPAAARNRVGVHLEYAEGRLSFYSILDPRTVVLLHQTQTTFTKPLYPGFSVDLGAKLKICNLKVPQNPEGEDEHPI